jgi:hypothetical protein
VTRLGIFFTLGDFWGIFFERLFSFGRFFLWAKILFSMGDFLFGHLFLLWAIFMYLSIRTIWASIFHITGYVCIYFGKIWAVYHLCMVIFGAHFTRTSGHTGVRITQVCQYRQS